MVMKSEKRRKVISRKIQPGMKPSHSILAPQFQQGVKMWQNASQDIALCFSWQLLKYLQVIVNTGRGTLDSKQTSKARLKNSVKIKAEGETGGWEKTKVKTSADCWLYDVIKKRKSSELCVSLQNCWDLLQCQHKSSLCAAIFIRTLYFHPVFVDSLILKKTFHNHKQFTPKVNLRSFTIYLYQE